MFHFFAPIHHCVFVSCLRCPQFLALTLAHVLSPLGQISVERLKEITDLDQDVLTQAFQHYSDRLKELVGTGPACPSAFGLLPCRPHPNPCH